MELTLWVVGTALLSLYFGARIGGEIERKRATAAFVEARASVSVNPDFITPNPLPWQDFQPAIVPRGSEPASMSQEWADDGSPAVLSKGSLPIALLRIGRVSLEVPVYTDTGERNLNRGAAWGEGKAALYCTHRCPALKIPGQGSVCPNTPE